MSWYGAAWNKYADFSGRARRKEYWYFVLFNLIIVMALVYVDVSIGAINYETGFGLMSGVFYLVALIPTLAVLVRRLHDTGRSGWWFFVYFIPLVGPFILFFFLIQGGQSGFNDHGPDPRMAAEA